MKDKKTESLTLKSLNNSVNKDFMPASAPDLANQAEPMDIFWKEKSSSFMPRRSNQERNDFIVHKRYFQHSLFLECLLNFVINQLKHSGL